MTKTLKQVNLVVKRQMEAPQVSSQRDVESGCVGIMHAALDVKTRKAEVVAHYEIDPGQGLPKFTKTESVITFIRYGKQMFADGKQAWWDKP